jgi:hypothetical protein
MNMNHYETKTNGSEISASPLFASVWLALYNELRKNLTNRYAVTDSDQDILNATKEK